MLRIHHPVFGRYYRISWNGIYHIPYRYIMIITEYNILWNIVTIYILWNIKYIYIFIYFPLFGVPTLAHKHIMDQRSGVAFGVPRLTRLLRLRKGDKTLDNSSRGCWFHTCCQGISWDAICSYLFIFAKQHSLEFMILHVWYVFFWRILKLRTLQPLLCTDSMLSTCETGFRGDVLAGGKLGLEPILAAARIAGMGQQSWLLTHWYNIYIYMCILYYIILNYIILYYIYIHIYIHICTYLSYPIPSHPIPSDPIRSVYLSIYLFAIWLVISPKLWWLTVRNAHFAGTPCAGEMRISRLGAKPRLGKLSCIITPMILQESQNCFGKFWLNHWTPQYLAEQQWFLGHIFPTRSSRGKCKRCWVRLRSCPLPCAMPVLVVPQS